MQKLTRDDLMTLEAYAAYRPEFRPQVMEHKKTRLVAVGPNVTLQFEDRMTMQYQIQEMLRVERIFEAEGIDEELESYNPMIPDGSNWKATMMIEYADADERKVALSKLIGIEDKTWVQVDGFDKVFCIADEDLERENDEKTSSVHFLRFELTEPMRAAATSGTQIAIGIDHENYQHQVHPVTPATFKSLVADLV